MVSTRLVELNTADGLTIAGAIFEPKKRTKTIIIWIPGLANTFHGGLSNTHVLANRLATHKISLSIFNTRGSHIVSFLKKQRGKSTKRIPLGVAFERFTDSAFDVAAMVHTVRKLGYSKIFILGSSTGANKLAYSGWRGALRGVSGGIMLGPISDIPSIRHDYGAKLDKILKHADNLVRRGKGNELLPASLVGSAIWGAARFISIALPKTREDTFPYYDFKRPFYWVKRWRIPLLVLLGSKDQYLDRPAKEVMDTFNKQCAQLKRYQSLIFHGADHKFDLHRKELADILAKWIHHLGV